MELLLIFKNVLGLIYSIIYRNTSNNYVQYSFSDWYVSKVCVCVCVCARARKETYSASKRKKEKSRVASLVNRQPSFLSSLQKSYFQVCNLIHSCVQLHL